MYVIHDNTAVPPAVFTLLHNNTLTHALVPCLNFPSERRRGLFFLAACGCIFSMLLELAYHLCSPEYRREDPIEDPLHRIGFDVDAGDPAGRQSRVDRARDVLGTDGDQTLDMISRHVRNHRKGWTWPYSTHKHLHGAAVNGILAGGMLGVTRLLCGPLFGGSHGVKDSRLVWVSRSLLNVCSFARFFPRGVFSTKRCSGGGENTYSRWVERRDHAMLLIISPPSDTCRCIHIIIPLNARQSSFPPSFHGSPLARNTGLVGITAGEGQVSMAWPERWVSNQVYA